MSKLVSAIREIMGAPFRHRGRGPKYYDCAGAVKEAYRRCGVDLPDFILYSREPHDDGLVRYVSNALGEAVYRNPVSIKALLPGDVLLMRFDIQPHHVGMVGDYLYGGLSLIHADGHTGRVLEQRLTPDMVKRITHVFRKPV